MGGHINNYLLEKSRVIYQQCGDNNFHSFYQLLKGAPEQMLNAFNLSRDFNSYAYLSSNNNKVQLPPKVKSSTFSPHFSMILNPFLGPHFVQKCRFLPFKSLIQL